MSWGLPVPRTGSPRPRAGLTRVGFLGEAIWEDVRSSRGEKGGCGGTAGTHKGPHTTPLYPCPYAIHDRVSSADQIPTLHPAYSKEKGVGLLQRFSLLRASLTFM